MSFDTSADHVTRSEVSRPEPRAGSPTKRASGVRSRTRNRLSAATNRAANYKVIRLLSETGRRMLADEAWNCMSAAMPHGSAVPASDDRDYEPESWSETAQGGPLLAEFINAPEIADTLHRLTGQRWAPIRGSNYGYTYRRNVGHNVGLHRDYYELTLVTCLDDQPGEGGDLLLYPQRISEPLSAIRATPDDGCVRLRLQPGETLLMFGKEIPHRVTSIGAGRTRITVAICYKRV